MPEIKPMLKLRATLSIDIDAKDYIHAAKIQLTLPQLSDNIFSQSRRLLDSDMDTDR